MKFCTGPGCSNVMVESVRAKLCPNCAMLSLLDATKRTRSDVQTSLEIAEELFPGDEQKPQASSDGRMYGERGEVAVSDE